jgi:hypothetical protein
MTAIATAEPVYEDDAARCSDCGHAPGCDCPHDCTPTGPETLPAAEVVVCLSCNRKLTAARSVAVRRGPTCVRKIAAAATTTPVLDGYTDAQRDRVAELIADAGIVPTSRPGVFRTVSSRGDVIYLTHEATCNCPAGLNGRACYHTAAARLLAAATRRAA